MSADKYVSIFSRQMKAIVYIYNNNNNIMKISIIKIFIDQLTILYCANYTIYIIIS